MVQKSKLCHQCCFRVIDDPKVEENDFLSSSFFITPSKFSEKPAIVFVLEDVYKLSIYAEVILVMMYVYVFGYMHTLIFIEKSFWS